MAKRRSNGEGNIRKRKDAAGKGGIPLNGKQILRKSDGCLSGGLTRWDLLS